MTGMMLKLVERRLMPLLLIYWVLATPTQSSYQVHRQREREREREKHAEKERDRDIDREYVYSSKREIEKNKYKIS